MPASLKKSWAANLIASVKLLARWQVGVQVIVFASDQPLFEVWQAPEWTGSDIQLFHLLVGSNTFGAIFEGHWRWRLERCGS